ncbi:hypothetical protein SH139x_002564 [Planctomycetaceae bacterium SH139]
MCRQKSIPPLLLAALVVTPSGLCGGVCHGQGTRGPSTSPMPANVAPSLQNPPPVLGGVPNAAAPRTELSAVPGPTAFSSPNPPSLSLGNPTYDPYSTGSTPGVFTPALPSQSPVPPPAALPGAGALGSMFGGWPGSGVQGSTTGYQANTPLPPPGFAPNAYPPPGYPPTAYPPNAYPPTAYPPSTYPSAGPPVLFPGGLMGGGYGANPGGYYNPFAEMAMPGAFKFLQGPRLRHGWLGGGDGGSGDFGVNETEVSVALAFPNFLWSGQPIYVLPSFSLDLWDGPRGAADLPSSAYEAFLDFGWQTDPNQILGIETGLRVGVFTDFDTFNSDSLRIMGQALGKFRLTPRTTLKAGVMYIDRIRYQLIPAGGILWQPTPYSRWDIYFPEPKVSRYLRTVGTKDVWGYVAGEYGGGSWTVTRTNNVEDRVDVNDMRVLVGLEWGRSDLIRSGRRTGFVEAGWVFEREILYDTTPGSFEPDSTFILRAGIGY